MNETMTVLKSGNMKIEDHAFLASQPTAVADGFKNVSKTWYDKTISFDEGMELLTKGRAETEDIKMPIDGVKFEEDSGKLVVNLDGNKVTPTKWALSQLGNRLGIPSKILTNWGDGDSQSIQTVVKVLQNGQRLTLAGEVQSDEGEDGDEKEVKNLLFRTRKDNSLRAVLSEKFLRLDNLWFLEAMSKIVPQGRLSHYDKSDGADTIYGNILIPDSLRKESDGGEYGGGMSLGNSEIGQKCVHLHPWLFAKICQNGCIWDQIKGVSYSRKHLGSKIDYDAQFKKLVECVDKQIPLIPQHITALMNTKSLKWSDSSKKLMAQAAIELQLTKKQGAELLLAYEFVPELSCFGLISALTRAGQKMPPEKWIEIDRYVSKLTDSKIWGVYSAKASALTSKDIESCYANVA